MELLASKQDQYIILEHGLGERVYGLVSGIGGFSLLSMSATDSLSNSWLIHRCV